MSRDKSEFVSDLAIDLQNVVKVYRRRVRALDGVTMQVHKGEVFGLLGPNGAGKSTLIKIMMTVIRKYKAQGTVLGRPVGDKSTLAKVGYLPEHHRFPSYLTGRQVLTFYAAMTKVPAGIRNKRADELLEVVGMKEWGKTKVSQYSKGMLQRVGLAQAMMNDPELVLLDEPTDGVDPVGRRDIRDILIRLREEGKTVFLNSHLLSELEMVCDRVAILVDGTVRTQGTLDDLTRESRRYEITIAGQSPEWIAEFSGVKTASVEPGKSLLVMSGAEPEPVQPLIDRLRAEGRTIVAVQPRRESLEDLFLRAVGDGEGNDHSNNVKAGGKA
ncbi:MAG TPA: ABC transporter ATP-binding protein [Phycisphaeraceae bacterium]|nr:ABC transporter ATP-binding protein [Phycisphaeraceae bacterium]